MESCIFITFPLSSVAIKINLKSIPPKNIFLKHGYCNDHFKLLKMGTGSFLTDSAITNWGRINRCKKAGMNGLQRDERVTK